MDAPLLLFKAKISWVTGCKPLGGTDIIASAIALPLIFGNIEPVVSSNPVSGLTITKFGADV